MRVLEMNNNFEDIRNQVEEQCMIQQAREDPQAFGKLYRRYIKTVFRYLYSRLGNIQDAEDVASQTFIAAFEKFEGFKKEKSFSAWLFTIARNKAVDYFRRNHSVEQLDDSVIPDTHEKPDRILEISDELNKISRLISALPEADQELLRLRYIAELTFPRNGSSTS